HRREILLVEAGDLFFPFLLACFGVQANEIVVVDLQIEVVAPHSHTAIAGVGAATGLPVVMPENGAVARVDGPGVIGCGHVDHAIDHQDAATKPGGTARGQVAAAEPAGDYAHAGLARAVRAATGVETADPSQTQVLDGGLVNRFQRTVPLARVIAGVRGPLIPERF